MTLIANVSQLKTNTLMQCLYLKSIKKINLNGNRVVILCKWETKKVVVNVIIVLSQIVGEIMEMH